MNSKPTIYIGQSGQQLRDALYSLDKRLGCVSPPSLLLDQQFRPSDPGECHLRKCGRDMVCWEPGCFVCGKNVVDLHDGMRRLAEQLDFMSTVTLVADVSSPFGHWAADQALDYVLDEFAPVCLHSVLLQPVACGGMDAYSSLLACSRLTEHSTTLMMRGADEFLFEDEVEVSRKTSGAARVLGLEDYYHWLACDLWTALRPQLSMQSRRYALWPHHVCSYPKRLVDVRSSLHKTLHVLSAQAKGRRTPDLVPARIVSSSLHRLHLCYQQKYPDMLPSIADTARIASSAVLRIEQHRVQVHSSAADASTAVHWASKGVKWMLYEDICDQLLSSAPAPPAECDGPLGKMPVSALAFESPYAEMELLGLARRCRAQAEVGAFAQQLAAQGRQMEEVQDAVMLLQDFLGQR